MNPEDLIETLESVHASGEFVLSGWRESSPILQVEGLGTIPTPMVPMILPALRSVASPAPYGRGPDTIVDPTVRRCHQIDAQLISLPAELDATLESIVEEVREGFGIPGAIQANLYKALVYGPGDFFAPHRDTEKEPGMFGTLVLTLPGEFSGGHLRVSHMGQAEEVDFAQHNNRLSWAAFYADCEHEVLPLESGARLALVFNLVNDGASSSPTKDEDAIEKLSAELRSWEDEPAKLVYVLDHRYSEAEFGWDRLKSSDRGRAHALREAAARSDVEVFLAQVSIDVLLSVEELHYRGRYGRYGGGRRGYGYDTDEVPDDLEIYDVIEDTCLLHGFIDSRNEPSSPESLPIFEERGELWPAGAIADEKPDSVSYHEATGNEGATLERMYRRSAVVLWPRSASDEVLIQQGPAAVAWAIESIDDQERVIHLVERIRHQMHSSEQATASIIARLIQLGCVPLASSLMIGLQGHLLRDKSWFIATLALLPERQASHIVTARATSLSPWDAKAFELLIAACIARASDIPLWQDALGALTEFLEQSRTPVSHAQSAIRAAWKLGYAPLQEVVLEWLFDDSALEKLTRAALALKSARELPEELSEHLIERLEDATHDEPTPPTDFQRPPLTDPHPPHLSVVSSFLEDPDQEVLHYPVRQDVRQRIRNTLELERADVDISVLKKGSPHRLVLKKNRATFERLAERHSFYLSAIDTLRE